MIARDAGPGSSGRHPVQNFTLPLDWCDDWIDPDTGDHMVMVMRWTEKIIWYAQRRIDFTLLRG